MPPIGLQVQERESSDAPVVVPGSLGISAWAVNSRRGPVGVAIQLLNFTEARKAFFAEASTLCPSYYMVKGLYANCGPQGAAVWLSRVVGAGATPASNFAQGGSVATSGLMTSSPASFPVDIFESDTNATFIGSVNGGGPTTATFNFTRAQITGAAATYAAPAASDTLKLTINGLPVTIVFAGTENTEALWLAAINSQIEGASAIDSGGQVRLQTDRFGSGAAIAVLNTGTATVLTKLGLTASSNSGTGNCANSRAVTGAEFKAVFDAAMTGSTVTVNANGSVTWASNTTGAASSVQLTSGSAVTPTLKVTGWDTALHSGSATGLQNLWTVSSAFLGLDDPGTWSNGKVFFEIQAASSGLGTQVDLVTYYQSDLDSAAVFQERFKNLTNANVVSTVNHSTKGSTFVKVALVGTPGSLPNTTLGKITLSAGTPGADGAVPAEAAYATALTTFNGQNVQIVLAPDLQTLLQGVNLGSYASGRGDVIALTYAGRGNTDTDLETIYPSLLAAKSFLAGYRGWVEVDDERGGTTFVPAIGHLIGAGYIRKVRNNGGFAHIAPAGPVANLLGVLSVDDGIYDQLRLQRVNKTGFNPVVFQSGLGFFAKTSRTFSTTDKWYSIHIRIQANFFIASFRNTFSILEQEGNTPDTQRRLRNPISTFLQGQFDNGGIETLDGGFKGNVLVTCDASNNTTVVVQQRRLVCDVLYRPTEVAESVEINLIRTTEGVKASAS